MMPSHHPIRTKPNNQSQTSRSLYSKELVCSLFLHHTVLNLFVWIYISNIDLSDLQDLVIDPAFIADAPSFDVVQGKLGESKSS